MKFKYDEFNNNEFESHKLTYNLIDPNTKVLDLGCATGYLAKELLKKGCKTWGVDGDTNAAKKAEKYCSSVIVSNLDECTSFPFPKKSFDYVILLDVIEHLVNPENTLLIIKSYLKENGKIIVSTPNIAHASIRWMLFRGLFEYTSTGIMDKTHVHFYTQDGLRSLIKRVGYRVLDIIPTNGMCKVPLLYKITDRLPYSWQYEITKVFPGLFSHQFIVVAKPVKRKG